MLKKIVVFFSLVLTAVIPAGAQYHYQDSKNVEMLRHSEYRTPVRTEIVIPQVCGYNVYKSDLHTHSVYSDGQVTPKYRVREAWLDGLDLIAVTEHIEYRPDEGIFYDYLKEYTNKEYKPGTEGLGEGKSMVDLNYAVKESQKEAVKYGILVIPGTEITRSGSDVGHFNALFTTDNNLIYDKDPVQAIRNAKAQGALVMHNHPGWTRKSIAMTETEKIAYGEGLIDGVEVMNSTEFYPGVIDRVREGNMFIAANTDIHASTAEEYNVLGGTRPMTLILAKDKSLDSIREALEAGRTIAYGFGHLCGSEELLLDLFKASVKLSPVDGKKVSLTNLTSIPYIVKKENGNPVRIAPFSTYNTSIPENAGTLSLTILNLWTGADTHLEVELPIK
jgi:hypothetical protein